MEKQKKEYFLFLKEAIKIYKPYIIAGIFMSIFIGLLTPIIISVNAKFIDSAISTIKQETSIQNLLFYLFMFLILTLIKNLEFVPNYLLQAKFIAKFREYFESNIIDKISKLDYKELENTKTHDLIKKITKDAELKMVNNIENTKKLVLNFISILSVLWLCISIGWYILIIVVLILIVTIWLSNICGKRNFDSMTYCAESDRKTDYISSIFMDKDMAAETKVFNTPKYLKTIFEKAFDLSADIYIRAEMINRPLSIIVVRAIGDIFLLAMYLLLLRNVLNKEISIGIYISIIAACKEIVLFITELMPDCITSLTEYKLYWEDVKKLINLSELNNEKEQHIKKASINKISFNNVYFKYPNSSQYTIENLSCEFEAGKHYAIVGENGAGKSTIIKLMVGLYKPTKGTITIDGKNVYNLEQKEISKIFSIAFQDFVKYNLSFKENILLGSKDKELDMDKLNFISSKLGVKDFIENQPNGYDTLLGKSFEHGVDLSGGEWQKLILTRLLYSDSLVRILDEPTASLDPKSESDLYSLFKEINTQKHDDKITIFISHRLSSTLLADKILLINEGKIEESGNYDELIRLGGKYYHMFNLQKQWYERENEKF